MIENKDFKMPNSFIRYTGYAPSAGCVPLAGCVRFAQVTAA